MCVYIFTYPSIVCRPPGLQNNRPPERCGAERRPCLLRRAPPTLRSLGAEPHAAAGRELFREMDTADCRNPCCYYHLHHHVVELPVRTSAWRYPSWLVASPFLSGGCGSAETEVGWAGRPCRFALASTSRSPCNGSCGAAHAQLLTDQPAPLHNLRRYLPVPCLHSRRMNYWLPLNIGISCLRFYASAGRETCPYLSGLIVYNDHYRTQGGKTFSIR